ncbi:MAG: asparagine synthase (glutamine-hydrolyzing) [Candidatus Dormibacteria bacterium]
MAAVPQRAGTLIHVCGIAGFTGNDRELLGRMLDSMVHRGPDGAGMEVNQHVCIGMRRLAIVDIDGGNQPLYSDDGALALINNGEIYNAPELRAELQASGHRFTTDHSDTEVILRGYEEWGQDVVVHLVGMFAFALWDGRRGELFLGRDRLGIKPLYYVARGAQVAFASEIKALFQDPTIPRRPNTPVVQRFLLFRVHDNGEETFFDGVKRLLPAHTMTIDATGITAIHRYWDPEVNLDFSGSRSNDSYAEEFAALFEKVVQRHLLSDVSLGVPLSGGLDSSGVVCTVADLMRRGSDVHTGGQLYSFSALYPGQSIDESEYIHVVEEFARTIPHYAYPKRDEFWNEISDWIWYQEEPTIASAPYAYYCVYRLASQHVKVMLSGNGGDELLAGYIPYFRTYLTSARDQHRWFAAARELVRGADLYRPYLGEAIRSRLPGGGGMLSMRPLLSAPPGSLAPLDFSADRNLNRRLAQDVLQYSTPNLLRYEDKNSMAFSVEARVPFLDHELVEYIFSLPIDQKIDGGWNRAVYRRAMRGRIPEKNRRRRSKIGFTNPERDWIREYSPQMRAIFDSPECRSRGLYDNDRLVHDLDAWLRGARGDPLIFWRTMVTELWMQRYIDEPVALAA